MKKTYLLPACEIVKLNLGDQLLDDKFGNQSGVPVGGDEEVGGFESKPGKFFETEELPKYDVWEQQ
ncbi:hypothetical protein [Prevotella sp. kh1p2]|uniref:hypothetical protein n=1 Tax=Prevotella sp. kh1p2 TaxID=1761883 RepID=UPI0008CB9A16|nr:hypothetical protein [Prevotella sp. kh1p2]SES69330.1 hypothetical protein SAMN04487825_10289 [Prevotella sp. kh1p2]SNU10311.1 hypothetical protein SAMN06298210_10273 [Prevotellaceae bacterium KH2P17]